MAARVCILALAGAAICHSPAAAQEVPQSEWPASVRTAIAEHAASCRESGGTLSLAGDLV